MTEPLQEIQLPEQDNTNLVIKDSQSEDCDSSKQEKLVKLPLGRIKTIIKLDPDVNIVSQDATYLIAKATELFISNIAKDCSSILSRSKKKTINIHHFNAVLDNCDSLLFLEGALDEDADKNEKTTANPGELDITPSEGKENSTKSVSLDASLEKMNIVENEQTGDVTEPVSDQAPKRTCNESEQTEIKSNSHNTLEEEMNLDDDSPLELKL